MPATVASPAGSVSVKAAPVSGAGRGLVRVTVNVEASPMATKGGENAFVTPTTTVTTVRVAAAGAMFPPPLSVVTPPGGMTFSWLPAALAVTTTVTVQLPFRGIVPPASATVPAVWLTVPEQVVAAVPPTVFSLAGSVSVKAAPVSATAAGLVSVIVNVEVFPAGTAGGEKPFVARAKDFRCLEEFASVPGKSFRIHHRNPRKLARAVRIAALDLRGRRYPVGTIIQLFPSEAMVKRGGGFNPEGGGWEFFKLEVEPGGTRIVGRTQNEREGKRLRNSFGACQDRRCHGASQAKPYDRVCEGHLPPLSLTDEEIEALRVDPRCP